MAYVESEKIDVFPLAKARTFTVTEGQTDKANNRLIGENNIARITRNIVDKTGYVLSYSNNILEFVLHGYYFKISNYTLSGNGDIYPTITLTEDPFPEIIGQDATSGENEGKYTGLTINESQPSSGIYFKISYTSGTINSECYQKFDESSFNITSIDCGEI